MITTEWRARGHVDEHDAMIAELMGQSRDNRSQHVLIGFHARKLRLLP